MYTHKTKKIQYTHCKSEKDITNTEEIEICTVLTHTLT